MHQRVVTAEGTPVTSALVERLLQDAVAELATPAGRFDDAAEIFRTVTLEEEFPTFLTIAAYSRYLVDQPAVEPVETTEEVAA